MAIRKPKTRKYFGNQKLNEGLEGIIVKAKYLERLVSDPEGLINYLGKEDEIVGKRKLLSIYDKLEEIDLDYIIKKSTESKTNERRKSELTDYIINLVLPEDEIIEVASRIPEYVKEGEEVEFKFVKYLLSKVFTHKVKEEEEGEEVEKIKIIPYKVEHVHKVKCSCGHITKHSKETDALLADEDFMRNFEVGKYESSCEKEKKIKGEHNTKIYTTTNIIKATEDLLEEYFPNLIYTRVKSGESTLYKFIDRIASKEEDPDHIGIYDFYAIRLVVKKEVDIGFLVDELKKVIDSYAKEVGLNKKATINNIDEKGYPREFNKDEKGKILVKDNRCVVDMNISLPYIDRVGNTPYIDMEIQVTDKLNVSQEEKGKNISHKKYKKKQEIERKDTWKDVHYKLYERLLPIFSYK